jgi:hypothetical protein
MKSQRDRAKRTSGARLPARGLGQFRRVLRNRGRAAVSVNAVPERSYNTRIHPIIARYVPSLAADAARLFSLGNEQKLSLCSLQQAFAM